MPRWTDAITRAGGVVYHLAALRHRRLWADHVAATAQFLATWQPTQRKLFVLGPSGGYSLPMSLLGEFTEVVGAEPDPMARTVFQRRFPEVSITWDDSDYLGPRNGAMTVAGLTELRARYPDYAVLFCNVLGQLPILHEEAQTEGFFDYIDAIPEALAGTSWASYHDRVSGPWPPAIAEFELPSAVATEALLMRVYPNYQSGVEFDYGDHLTGGLAPNRPRRLWTWQRTPAHFHVIEGVHV